MIKCPICKMVSPAHEWDVQAKDEYGEHCEVLSDLDYVIWDDYMFPCPCCHKPIDGLLIRELNIGLVKWKLN